MKRPGSSSTPAIAGRQPTPRGYTLIEILVATALTLLLMAAVVRIFAWMGDSVSDSRSVVEMNDRLRAAVARLQMDLEGVTVTMRPPRAPADDEGYFEYSEGPLGVTVNVASVAVDAGGYPDTTVADFDDRVMFTTRSPGKPFVGRFFDTTQNASVPVESPVAEVAWFVRGGNLYRRVLLVLPSQNLTGQQRDGFFGRNDISARLDASGAIVGNTLGDLTKRENRFGHLGSFPYDVRATWGLFGLPTLGETSAGLDVWNGPNVTAPATWADVGTTDFWNDPKPKESAPTAPRVSEDVILSNVIGFDVKAWDPQAPVYDPSSGTVIGYGRYVDLNYTAGANSNLSYFSGPGMAVANPNVRLDMTYDTWSTHYEHSMFATPGNPMVNGFDDNNNGVVDDLGERIKGAPYPVPLRGIQIKLRVFEPDSRQVREVTIVQDFLPK